MSLTLILLIIIAFFPILNWNTYENAGYSGWKSAIPFLNYYVWLKIIRKPLWWYIFLLLPFINFFVVMLMVVETVKCYNRFSLGEQALAVIFPFVYLPWLGITKKHQYLKPEERKPFKKTIVREWVDAIIFAVIAATIIRMFLVEAYTIPTSSMEKSLLVGDFLFVSKLSYGPKIPNTPIAFPFVHHTLPLTKYSKSYVEWIKLPYYRFPGFRNIHNNDVVVFNYPDGDTVALKVQNQSYYDLTRRFGRHRIWNDKMNFGDIVARPVDKRENYIKRCIAIPGDTLEIIDQNVYINGKASPLPEQAQFRYLVRTDGTRINPKALERLGVTERVLLGQQDEYEITLTANSAEQLKNFVNVKEVKKIKN